MTKADEERTRLAAILTDKGQKSAEPPKRGLSSREADELRRLVMALSRIGLTGD